jgi:cytochrome c556
MGAMFDTAIAAANKGDLDAVKASCKPCHDAFRDDYRKRFGSKAP